MPATPSSGPASAKSEEDCLKILAQEVASLRDRELPTQDQADTSSASSRPAGGAYPDPRSSGAKTSATDALIVKNIRAAMADLRPKP